MQRQFKEFQKIKNLIPGGTGFIGYHLSLFLSKKGGLFILYQNQNLKILEEYTM